MGEKKRSIFRNVVIVAALSVCYFDKVAASVHEVDISAVNQELSNIRLETKFTRKNGRVFRGRGLKIPSKSSTQGKRSKKKGKKGKLRKSRSKLMGPEIEHTVSNVEDMQLWSEKSIISNERTEMKSLRVEPENMYAEPTSKRSEPKSMLSESKSTYNEPKSNSEPKSKVIKPKGTPIEPQNQRSEPIGYNYEDRSQRIASKSKGSTTEGKRSTSKSKGGKKKKGKRKYKGKHTKYCEHYDSGTERISYDERYFTPAQPLDYFKNEIDEEMFQWFNKAHIIPGHHTCGFLYPKLGHLENAPYPTIKVKFCIRFAEEQPAPKGNLVVHCGGPSSLSSCLLAVDIGEDNFRNYNVIALDQRGLGESWPTFAHEECSYGVERYENGTVAEYLGIDPFALDIENATEIQIFLDEQKQRMSNCWTCLTCDFIFPAIDGSNHSYHFLDFSGTRQVAEDIDRFREVIGADKISLYGISYGTQVMATYATMFPERVDKFIVDSNMPPHPDLLAMGKEMARNTHHRLSYASFTCRAQEVLEPGSCPVDMGLCLNAIQAYLHDTGLNTLGAQFEVLYSLLNTFKEFNLFTRACNAANDWNEADFLYSYVKAITIVAQVEEPYITCLPGLYNVTSELVEPYLEDAGIATFFSNSLAAFLVAMEDVDDEVCANFTAASGDIQAQQEVAIDMLESLFVDDETDSDRRRLERSDDEFYKNCSGVTLSEATFNNQLEVLCYSPDPRWEEIEVSELPYTSLMESSAIAQTLVIAQSMSGGGYDDHYVIGQVRSILDTYGGSFYATSASHMFLYWYTLGYFWPQAQPVSPAGDPTITGIVAGQLYDYVTSYDFTQDMKMAFPRTHLITSQWVQHGMDAAQSGSILDDRTEIKTCQGTIVKYLQSGFVDVVDGHVCSSPLPNPFSDF